MEELNPSSPLISSHFTCFPWKGNLLSFDTINICFYLPTFNKCFVHHCYLNISLFPGINFYLSELFLWEFATQSVVYGPTPSASPESLSEMQNLRPIKSESILQQDSQVISRHSQVWEARCTTVDLYKMFSFSIPFCLSLSRILISVSLSSILWINYIFQCGLLMVIS